MIWTEIILISKCIQDCASSHIYPAYTAMVLDVRLCARCSAYTDDPDLSLLKSGFLVWFHTHFVIYVEISWLLRS